MADESSKPKLQPNFVTGTERLRRELGAKIEEQAKQLASQAEALEDLLARVTALELTSGGGDARAIAAEAKARADEKAAEKREAAEAAQRLKDGGLELVLAAEEGREDDALGWIASEQCALDERNADGKTALMIACESGLAALAAKLIEVGADVAAKDDSATTALVYAIESKLDAVALAMLGVTGAGAVNVNAVNDSGSSALTMACYKGRDAVAVRLIELGANVAHADLEGDTPLSLAKSKASKMPLTLAAIAKAGSAAALPGKVSPPPRKPSSGGGGGSPVATPPGLPPPRGPPGGPPPPAAGLPPPRGPPPAALPPPRGPPPK